MNELGAQLRQRRTALNKSQEEVAELAGVSQQTVSRIENGHDNVPFGKIKAVASALGVAIEASLAA